MKRAPKRRVRVAAELNPADIKRFRAVERYVRSYCGKQVSRADVLRYLVRNWAVDNG